MSNQQNVIIPQSSIIKDGNTQSFSAANIWFQQSVHQSIGGDETTTPSRVVQHIYTELVNQNLAENNLPPTTRGAMHPAVQDVALKLISDSYQGTNQTTIGVLMAIKEVIKDFQPKNSKAIHLQEMSSLIRDVIQPCFQKCRRLFAGTSYSISEVITMI
mmetsp:Transcript_16334/g.27628  ORF Transcript_16334/g.27628 Transcript_16334/m.27628 type:complete len:159 (-) Transcript_16334:1081-1557(-)